eukprot:12065905-Alexandrium_andersonii.AAC.1
MNRKWGEARNAVRGPLPLRRGQAAPRAPGCKASQAHLNKKTLAHAMPRSLRPRPQAAAPSP